MIQEQTFIIGQNDELRCKGFYKMCSSVILESRRKGKNGNTFEGIKCREKKNRKVTK